MTGLDGGMKGAGRGPVPSLVGDLVGGENGAGLGLKEEMGRDDGVKVTGLVGRLLPAGLKGGTTGFEGELLLMSGFLGGTNCTGLGMKVVEGGASFLDKRSDGEGFGGRAGAAYGRGDMKVVTGRGAPALGGVGEAKLVGAVPVTGDTGAATGEIGDLGAWLSRSLGRAKGAGPGG